MWLARAASSARIAAMPPLPAPSVTVGITFSPLVRAALIASVIDDALLTVMTVPSVAALRKNGEMPLTTSVCAANVVAPADVAQYGSQTLTNGARAAPTVGGDALPATAATIPIAMAAPSVRRRRGIRRRYPDVP